MSVVWLSWQLKYIGVPEKPKEVTEARWHGMLLCAYSFIKSGGLHI